MPVKTPRDSQVQMQEMVLPQHINPQSTIFGGVVMSWVDIAASMCAGKHCRLPVVTVHVDELSFLAPIKMGHYVTILASLNYVGNTSMEIGVKVISENPRNGVTCTTTTAYLTFVALDELGRPCKVPPLKVETKEEKRRFENAKKRVEHRKQLRGQLNKKKND